MKIKVILLACLTMVIVSVSPAAFAHSGGLDSGLGHKDRKNVSGLGAYHHHCGDYPAHLHGPSGLCPYSAKYKAYKAIVDELKTYADKATSDKSGVQTFAAFTEEDVARMETLLLDEMMPFKLTPELLSAETTMYGKTNIKGLNVRKKQSTGSAKVCTIPVTGTVLLITQDMGNGWHGIMVFEDNKSQTGYIKTEMVDLIEKPEYLLGLAGNL